MEGEASHEESRSTWSRVYNARGHDATPLLPNKHETRMWRPFLHWNAQAFQRSVLHSLGNEELNS